MVLKTTREDEPTSYDYVCTDNNTHFKKSHPKAISSDLEIFLTVANFFFLTL